jgi:hypothetical protein
LKDEIEKNNNFYKKTKKKIRNKNNEDQIKKDSTINLNWIMKLKINKALTKKPMKKIRNQKNEK